jgi:hypothetical protein
VHKFEVSGRRAWRLRALMALATPAVIVSILLAPTSADALTSYTWTGEGAFGSGWSSSSNWLAGAPSGSVETLSFPTLTGICAGEESGHACYTSENNVSGLTATELALELGEHQYALSGAPITLGAGGIKATNTIAARGVACLRMPIALGTSQTWTIDGNEAFGTLSPAEVTGTSSSLAIDLNHRGQLTLSACPPESNIEVGPVAITGEDPGDTGFSAFENGNVGLTGQLNATDDRPVALTDAALFVNGTGNDTVGALSSNGGLIGVGSAADIPAGLLKVAGALTLNPTTLLEMSIDGEGTTGGVDYGQISASGEVKLEGAELLVYSDSTGGCATLKLHNTYTLLTTTGTLEGTFAGLPDGALISIACSGTEPTAVIHYTANAVTATVEPAGAPSGASTESQQAKEAREREEAKRRQELAAKARPPAPVLGQSADVVVGSGQVLVRLPGASTFVALSSLAQIPFGTIVNATNGSVAVTTAGPHGRTQTVSLSGGEFQLTQSPNGSVVAKLTGGDFSVCPTARERAHIASTRATGGHVVRKLWADGHGNFTTAGNYASASVRGTRWLTEDLCEGTLIHVASDRVAVTNFVNHRHVTIKAGHSYLAKAPGLGR